MGHTLREALHDVVIAGTGPIGSTLALLLSGQDLDVLALDAREPGQLMRGERTLALSYGTRQILERIGVWTDVDADAGVVTPILAVDVSQAGGFGVTTLHAEESGLPALGYVVAYSALQRALDAALERAGVAVRFGCRVERVEGGPHAATLAIAGATGPATLPASLAVVADGSGTQVAGVARSRREYGQAALVASVWRDRPHEGIAYERFTSEGPVALLPEGDHYGLVWTLAPDRVEPMCALDDAAFIEALSVHFGRRVGGFTRVAARRAFPLVLETARPVVTSRTVLVGNAAQQVHPVAGQGFNLGMRDAFELARTLLGVPRASVGTASTLARYAAARSNDRAATIAFTHGLVRTFGNAFAPARVSRGLALAVLDTLPFAKRAFARAMLHGLR